MKKIIVMSILIFSSLCTACGNKQIICEGNLIEDNFSTKVTVSGEFKNDKLSNQTIEMEVDLTDYLAIADIDTYYDSFKSAYAEYENYEGISIDITKSENSILIVMNIDLEEVDEGAYKLVELGSNTVDVSSNAYLKGLTDMGLICR